MPAIVKPISKRDVEADLLLMMSTQSALKPVTAKPTNAKPRPYSTKANPGFQVNQRSSSKPVRKPPPAAKKKTDDGLLMTESKTTFADMAAWVDDVEAKATERTPEFMRRQLHSQVSEPSVGLLSHAMAASSELHRAIGEGHGLYPQQSLMPSGFREVSRSITPALEPLSDVMPRQLLSRGSDQPTTRKANHARVVVPSQLPASRKTDRNRAEVASQSPSRPAKQTLTQSPRLQSTLHRTVAGPSMDSIQIDQEAMKQAQRLGESRQEQGSGMAELSVLERLKAIRNAKSDPPVLPTPQPDLRSDRDTIASHNGRHTQLEHASSPLQTKAIDRKRKRSAQDTQLSNAGKNLKQTEHNSSLPPPRTQLVDVEATHLEDVREPRQLADEPMQLDGAEESREPVPSSGTCDEIVVTHTPVVEQPVQTTKKKRGRPPTSKTAPQAAGVVTITAPSPPSTNPQPPTSPQPTTKPQPSTDPQLTLATEGKLTKSAKRRRLDDDETDAENDGDDLSKSKKSKKSRKSTGTASGSFTEQERKIVQQAFNTAQQENNTSEDAMKHLIMEEWRSDQLRTFRMLITEQLPDRTRSSLRKYCQRAYHTSQRGPWTPEEDETLRRAFELDKNNWSKIGSTVGRTAEACRDRWRNVVGVEHLVIGPWTEQEEKRLQDVVDEVLKTTKKPDDAEPHVNWNLVSQKVGGTRSAKLCRERWKVLKSRPDTVNPAVRQRTLPRDNSTHPDWAKAGKAIDEFAPGDILDVLAEIADCVEDRAQTFADPMTFWTICTVKYPDSRFSSVIRRRILHDGIKSNAHCKDLPPAEAAKILLDKYKQKYTAKKLLKRRYRSGENAVKSTSKRNSTDSGASSEVNAAKAKAIRKQIRKDQRAINEQLAMEAEPATIVIESEDEDDTGTFHDAQE